MESKLATEIFGALKDSGIECRMVSDYSGRGMYGAETFAVEFNASAMDLLNSVINESELFTEVEAGQLRLDNMGLGLVLY